MPGEGFTLVFPGFAVGRLGDRARDLALVILFVEIAHHRPVGQGDRELVSQPAAEFASRPVSLARQRGIIDHRQNPLPDLLGIQEAGTASSGAVGQPIDPGFIEALDPQTQSPLADPAVAPNHLEGGPHQQQVNGIETAKSLFVRPTTQGRLQLLKGAVFRKGELTGPTDFPF